MNVTVEQLFAIIGSKEVELILLKAENEQLKTRIAELEKQSPQAESLP
jgi:hypothetical protein